MPENKPSLSSLIGATSLDTCIFMDDALFTNGLVTKRTRYLFADLTFDQVPTPLDPNEERIKNLCDLTNVLNILCKTQRSTTFTDPPVFDQDTVGDLLKVTRMIDTMLLSVEPILRRRIEILDKNRPATL